MYVYIYSPKKLGLGGIKEGKLPEWEANSRRDNKSSEIMVFNFWEFLLSSPCWMNELKEQQKGRREGRRAFNMFTSSPTEISQKPWNPEGIRSQLVGYPNQMWVRPITGSPSYSHFATHFRAGHNHHHHPSLPGWLAHIFIFKFKCLFAQGIITVQLRNDPQTSSRRRHTIGILLFILFFCYFDPTWVVLYVAYERTKKL